MNRTAENVNQKSASQISQLEASDDDLEPITLKDGVIDWIKSLQGLSLPCAPVSYLNRNQVEAILDYTALSSLFSNSTTVTVGYMTVQYIMVNTVL